MSEMPQSAMIFGGLVVFAAFVVLVVEQVARRLVNCCAADANRYPHRVANELPRTLHKPDHDEVLELKDETELSRR
jgi:hypothetical protein